MSKSYRLAQIAQSVFLNEHARVDLLRQGAEEGTLRRNQIVRGPVSSLFLSQGATAMASEQNLQELFHDTLKDIYFAEKKILSALPKMAKAAQSEELKSAFQKHESQTEEHVARLEKVFDEIDEKPRSKTCDAIMGIIEEGQEIMKEFKGAPALDAGLLAAAHAVEHYETARYGTLKTWAKELGLNQAVRLLEGTLSEEKETDETLTRNCGKPSQAARASCLTYSRSRRDHGQPKPKKRCP
jgi:ferritin-like metal-binding protein YciE